MANMQLLDLSHTVSHGMITYPGLPGPEISDHLSREASRERYAPGTEFQIGRIDMVANTGTYLDTPAHRFPDGFDLAGLPIEQTALLPSLVVDGVGLGALDGLELAGHAVLFRTGWDRHWGSEAYGAGGHPFLDRDTTDALVARGAAVVGIDSVNIDDTSTGERPVHTALLGAGILIVEHLTKLDGLPNGPFTFTAVPVKVAGMGTFPVRAFAAWE
jgi:kynurenine formamidase